MVKAPRLKPGPKAEAGLRHRKAALYFCSVAHDEGWTLERISNLCQALYGVRVAPRQIADWVALHRKAAEKIKVTEIRAIDDSMVS
jgi:hypothetical protein